MGKTPTISRGFARYEYDGEILGCSGKHWVPDPVLFGAVGIPNQNYTISLPCSVLFECLERKRERERVGLSVGVGREQDGKQKEF